MLKNYFKTAFRNLIRNKGYSAINIGGLAVGMAVAILIGLWIWDELSFNKYHRNYDRIAQVMQHVTYNNEISSETANPVLMAQEIRNKFGSDFKFVLQASWNTHHTLTYGEKKFLKEGSFFEPGVTEMLSLKILKGTKASLKDPYSILLSESIAKIFFGEADPIDKVMKVDNKFDVKVTGVYEDFPYNSSFRAMTYILPWDLFLVQNTWINELEDPWGSNFTRTFAQVADNADIKKVSAKIKNVKYDQLSRDERKYKPAVFLHPMKKWHLYADFKNGINTGGRIEYVWLFGIVGVFVLILACVNFMNLSTARSEKRAREVGVRKAIGSMRRQLVVQFFGESFLVAFFAFVLSLGLVMLALPFFNEVADKKLFFLGSNYVFWLIGITVCIFTGLISGIYPALYLSSFKPVRVLKGTFRVGRYSSIPRKVLVVLQFAVSVSLIIGTIVVYQQIQHAKNRPVGYNRESLLQVGFSEEMLGKFESIRNELKNSGLIVEMAASISPATAIWRSNGGFTWEGKDPNQAVDFPNNGVTHEYGKVIGWEIKDGRDFSREFATDSAAFIINESAARFLGWKHPVGKILKWEDQPYTVIGVVKDLLIESPYESTRACFFHVTKNSLNILQFKISPGMSASKALSGIEKILKKFAPASAFEFRFVDEDFNKKFGEEERIGKIATCFAVLAILISCLGLFGMASFVAEQRTKEIGIRKVLGASVSNLWQLLSRQFVLLVCISLLISVPLAYYFMQDWLQHYTYRTHLSWWIFVAACGGAILITLATVSIQATKAAIANPVNSLRSE